MNVGHSRLLVACLVVALVAGGGLSLLAEPTDAQSASRLVQQDAVDADEIQISIRLREDGSAAWSIEFWSVLSDDEGQAAFESLRADIESDPENYTQSFAGRIETTVAAASNATGREMAADNFTVTTERQSLAREYGVVRYTFDWDGFARIEGETLSAGDAIDGLFLDAGTRLSISWPTGYELDSVSPDPDDRRETTVLWRGTSTEFIGGEPRVTLTQSRLGLGTIAGLFGIGALLMGLAGWLLRRRAGESTTEPALDSETNASTEVADPDTDPSDDPADSTTAPDSASTSQSEHVVDGPEIAVQESGEQDPDPQQDSEAEERTEPAGADSESREIDTELLSNEEQVMQLLEANGGRMKQQTIVKELEWTDAKTSKVVSGMREDGTIESFRIGRENVLTTPDDDPEEPGL